MRRVSLNPVLKPIVAASFALACADLGLASASHPSPALLLTRVIGDDGALAGALASEGLVRQLAAVLATRSEALSELARLDESAMLQLQLILAAERRSRDGGSSARRQQTLATHRAELEHTLTDQAMILQGLRNDVVAMVEQTLGAESAVVAQRMMLNAGRAVPSAFKCLDLNPAAWRTLEIACRRMSAGEPLTPAESSALSEAQSSALVQTVQSRIDGNLPAIRSAIIEMMHAAAQPVPVP